jgi:hypothetical protein
MFCPVQHLFGQVSANSCYSFVICYQEELAAITNRSRRWKKYRSVKYTKVGIALAEECLWRNSQIIAPLSKSFPCV